MFPFKYPAVISPAQSLIPESRPEFINLVLNFARVEACAQAPKQCVYTQVS